MRYSTVFAALALAAADDTQYGLVAIHSGDINVHLQAIGLIPAGSSENLGIGKSAKPATFSIKTVNNFNYLYTGDNFIEQQGSNLITDPTVGTDGFSVDDSGNLELQGKQSFLACPSSDGGYTVSVATDNGQNNCDGGIGIQIKAQKTDGGAAASGSAPAPAAASSSAAAGPAPAAANGAAALAVGALPVVAAAVAFL